MNEEATLTSPSLRSLPRCSLTATHSPCPLRRTATLTWAACWHSAIRPVLEDFSDFNEDGTFKTDVGVLLKVKQISCYGNDSYGGMSGRDIMALAVGLYESCDFNYMNERVAQCNYLAEGFYGRWRKGSRSISVIRFSQ